MSRPAIPPLSRIEALDEQWEEARKACADRASERGEDSLAMSYLQGEQDDGWGMRHELKRILAKPRDWSDPDDAPPLGKEWFDKAELREGDRVVRKCKGAAK